MIYKAIFYNQTGNNVRHSLKSFLFTDCKANDNPIDYTDNLGKQNTNLVWFELFEYNQETKKFDLFFCGMNF